MKLATVLSYKPIDNDTRVKNQIKSLKSSGFKVEIIDLPSSNFEKQNSVQFYFKYLIDLFNLNGFKKLFPKKNKFSRIPILFNLISFFSFFFYKILIEKIIFKLMYWIVLNQFSKTLIKYIFVFIELKRRKIEDKPSLIISNDLLTVPYGVYLKIKNKSKLIYDMHEYELHRVPVPSMKKKILLIIIEEFFIPFTDVIFTVSYNIKKIYKKRFPEKKISLVLNAPTIQNFKIKNNAIKYKSKINFIHVGNISYGRNIEALINYFKKSKHNLTFLGSVNKIFDDKFNFFKKINSHKNISYMEPVEPDDINEIVNNFDCSLFFYDTSVQNYNYALPNKLLLSLIENSPIICFKSKELLDFQRRFNIKLNLINNISDLDQVDIFCPQLSLEAKKYLSFHRQKKTIERYAKILM